MFDLEPYMNGEKCATSGSIFMNGLIVHENKDDWGAIVRNNNIPLYFNQMEAALDDLRTFLDHIVIDYHLTTGIFVNSVMKMKRNVCYYLVNDLTFKKLSNEIARDVSYGKQVTLVINSTVEATETMVQLKFLEHSIRNGAFNLIIKNGLKLVPEILRLSVDQSSNPLPAFVVLRDSDYVSAIELLPVQLNSISYKNVLFLVQESQIKVVEKLFDELWSKIEPKNTKYSYELVNYDLNTILDNNQDHSIVGNKINLLAFRDKFEVVKLLNHCPDVPFVSIWHKNPSACTYLTENVNTSNLFWFNSVHNYSPHIPLLDSNSNELIPKDVFVGDCLNLKNEDLKSFKVLENYLSKKPIKLPLFKLIELIIPCLNSEELDRSIVYEYLNVFYQKLTNLHETKDGIYTTKHYPIGFVLLFIDTDDDLTELFKLIITCLLSNNVVYLSIKSGLTKAASIQQFIERFSRVEHDLYFENMLVVDKADVYADQKLKPMIKHNNKHLGTCITYSQQMQNVDFRSLEHKLFTCKTTFKPHDVLDNTI